MMVTLSILTDFSDFFQTIVNFFTLIWDYVQGVVRHLATFVSMIPSFFGVSDLIYAYIWSPVAISMMFVLLVSVVKIFVGRDND